MYNWSSFLWFEMKRGTDMEKKFKIIEQGFPRPFRHGGICPLPPYGGGLQMQGDKVLMRGDIYIMGATLIDYIINCKYCYCYCYCCYCYVIDPTSVIQLLLL